MRTGIGRPAEVQPLPRLIIDEATDRDYERGTDRKQRIAAPEGSVMIF